MSVVVGVDVGSRSVRAVGLDRDGNLAGHSAADYEGAAGWPAGRADPMAWRDAVRVALERLFHENPEAESPAALAVGGQSPTAVPVSGGLAVTYQYSAGLDGGLAAQQEAQCRQLQAEHPGAQVCQLWDWLLHSLGAPLVQGRWPEDAPLAELGSPVPTGTVVGEADGTWGLRAGTPLVPGAPDAILAFWAAGLDELGRGCDPGGRTGGLVVTAERVDPVPGLMRMASPARGLSMIGGPVSAHGASLEWLAQVTGHSLGSLLELAAGVPAGAGGVTFLPYLEGERVPRWQRGLRGEFHGLGGDTGVAELARAVLEGAAYGLAHVERVLEQAGVDTRVVTCTGSPSKSRLWCEIKASVLGIPFDVPTFSEMSAYGAALAAGAGAGWWPRPGASGPGAWPRPGMARVEPAFEQAYEDGFERFLQLGDAAERRMPG